MLRRPWKGRMGDVPHVRRTVRSSVGMPSFQLHQGARRPATETAGCYIIRLSTHVHRPFAARRRAVVRAGR
jgi:hypothetical protein